MITEHQIDDGQEIKISWTFHDASFSYEYWGCKGIQQCQEVEAEIVAHKGMSFEEAKGWLEKYHKKWQPNC